MTRSGRGVVGILASFDAVSGADDYQVYRNGSRIATLGGGATSYDDTGASPGTTYTYKVRVRKSGNWSDLSSGNSGTRAEAPSNPGSLTASEGDLREVPLSWGEADGIVDAYEVCFAEAGTDVADAPEVYSGGERSYLIEDLEDATTYVGYVRAVNDAGASDWRSATAETLAAPPAPQGFAASDGTNPNGVDLDWSAADTAETYRLYRDGNELTTVTGTRYEDTSANAGITYTYEVRAENGAGSSSRVADTGERMVAPDAPEGVEASDNAFADRVEVDWQSVEGASEYEIARDDNLIATVGSPGYADTGAEAGEVHTYGVRAVNAAGRSEEVTDTGFSAITPGAPTSIAATDGAHLDRVEVRWGEVANATEYRVYRDGEQVATPEAAAWTDPDVTPGTEYTYAVSASNPAGESGLVQDAGYALAEPAAPASLTASSASQQHIRLTWPESEDADVYRIYREGAFIAETGETYYSDAALDMGESATYTVTAENRAGESPASPEATGTRAEPEGLSSEPGMRIRAPMD